MNWCLTRLTGEAYQNFGKISKQIIAQRINVFLNRTDFIYIENGHFTLENGENIFSEVCPTCQGYMSRQGYKSREAFTDEGGNIITFAIHRRSV